MSCPFYCYGLWLLIYKLFWSELCTSFLSSALRETPGAGQHQACRWPPAETQPQGDQCAETTQQSWGGVEEEGESVLKDQGKDAAVFQQGIGHSPKKKEKEKFIWDTKSSRLL